MKALLAASVLLATQALAAEDDAADQSSTAGVVLTNRPSARSQSAGIQALPENEAGGKVMVLTNRSAAARAAETHDISEPAEAQEKTPEPPPAPEPEVSQLSGPSPTTPEQTPPAFGQWVDTAQDGWLYMPYGEQYTSEGSSDDECPYQYDYLPSYGWTWLPAPWVWGWGAYPNFGAVGPWRYGWYRGLYKSGYGWGGYRGGGPGRGGGSGHRAAYSRRGGYGSRAGGYRGGAPRFRGGFRGGGGFRGAAPRYIGHSGSGGFGGGGFRGGGGRGGRR